MTTINSTPKMIPIIVQLPESMATPDVELMLADIRAIRNEIRGYTERIESAVGRYAHSYNEAEAAHDLGIAELTLARLRRSGKIGFTRVGGRARYSRKNIEDFIERGEIRLKKSKRISKGGK